MGNRNGTKMESSIHGAAKQLPRFRSSYHSVYETGTKALASLMDSDYDCVRAQAALAYVSEFGPVLIHSLRPKKCNYRICVNQTNSNLTKFIITILTFLSPNNFIIKT